MEKIETIHALKKHIGKFIAVKDKNKITWIFKLLDIKKTNNLMNGLPYWNIYYETWRIDKESSDITHRKNEYPDYEDLDYFQTRADYYVAELEEVKNFYLQTEKKTGKDFLNNQIKKVEAEKERVTANYDKKIKEIKSISFNLDSSYKDLINQVEKNFV